MPFAGGIFEEHDTAWTKTPYLTITDLGLFSLTSRKRNWRRGAVCQSPLPVWDADTGQELCSFAGHTAPIKRAAFTPDGKAIDDLYISFYVKVIAFPSSSALDIIMDDVRLDRRTMP